LDAISASLPRRSRYSSGSIATPPLTEPTAKAARAQAGICCDNFVVILGRQLNQRPKLRQEISDEVDANAQGFAARVATEALFKFRRFRCS
jgi:hypothetical protein